MPPVSPVWPVSPLKPEKPDGADGEDDHGDVHFTGEGGLAQLLLRNGGVDGGDEGEPAMPAQFWIASHTAAGDAAPLEGARSRAYRPFGRGERAGSARNFDETTTPCRLSPGRSVDNGLMQTPASASGGRAGPRSRASVVRRALTAAVLLVSVAACGGTSSTAKPTATTSAATGSAPIPELLRFSAPLVGGGTFSGADYAGRATAFWFWAPT